MGIEQLSLPPWREGRQAHGGVAHTVPQVSSHTPFYVLKKKSQGAIAANCTLAFSSWAFCVLTMRKTKQDYRVT